MGKDGAGWLGIVRRHPANRNNASGRTICTGTLPPGPSGGHNDHGLEPPHTLAASIQRVRLGRQGHDRCGVSLAARRCNKTQREPEISTGHHNRLGRAMTYDGPAYTLSGCWWVSHQLQPHGHCDNASAGPEILLPQCPVGCGVDGNAHAS